MVIHRINKKTAIVLVGDTFVQLDRPTRPFECWFDYYFDIPSDNVIVNNSFTDSQKEVALSHCLLRHPHREAEVLAIAKRHKLDTAVIINSVKQHHETNYH